MGWRRAFFSLLVAMLLLSAMRARGAITRHPWRAVWLELAESQITTHAQLSERLQAQERALARAVEERLDVLGRRVGENLQKNSELTHNHLADLKTRLAIIESAQKSISELSGQVVGLQELLANKQARGAFGEIQLMDLVRSALPPSAYLFQAGALRQPPSRLPDQFAKSAGPIAIDAKFPLESYRALREARDKRLWPLRAANSPRPSGSMSGTLPINISFRAKPPIRRCSSSQRSRLRRAPRLLPLTGRRGVPR